ncbi:hypothetical protein [Nonomuraea aurantiaca]|uniref:hypothetical protein n=1 Tax=Nonomuraea aurantiaca TaxID=2878562 RepID=UPI001CDA2D32|nr:hypothetical protein [Nonomuraea aurantiaca]MCA2220917.1 hypothetical protein [Nonomuraea aurantiaca]
MSSNQDDAREPLPERTERQVAKFRAALAQAANDPAEVARIDALVVDLEADGTLDRAHQSGIEAWIDDIEAEDIFATLSAEIVHHDDQLVDELPSQEDVAPKEQRLVASSHYRAPVAINTNGDDVHLNVHLSASLWETNDYSSVHVTGGRIHAKVYATPESSGRRPHDQETARCLGTPRKENLGPTKLHREQLEQIAKIFEQTGVYFSSWTDSTYLVYESTSSADIPDLASKMTPVLKIVRMIRRDLVTNDKIMELTLDSGTALLLRYRVDETANDAARIREICKENKRTWAQAAFIPGLIVGTIAAIIGAAAASQFLGSFAGPVWLSLLPVTMVPLVLGLGFKSLWKRLGAGLTQAVIINVPEGSQGGLLSRRRDDLIVAMTMFALSTATNVLFTLLLQHK